MKDKPINQKTDELREEYTAEQIQSGVRGKYLSRYQAGLNIVRLEPDVAAVFGTEEKVNEALRSLIRNSQPAEPAEPAA